MNEAPLLPKKFYFAASIWGSPLEDSICNGIIAHLHLYGLVLSEKLFEPAYKSVEHLSMRAIHDRDIGWIRETDAIIADVSSPSLGVGYEIREGLLLKKPILCLYRLQAGKRLSAMIAGAPGLRVIEYETLEGALQAVDAFCLQQSFSLRSKT